jgi:hypothetical protein
MPSDRRGPAAAAMLALIALSAGCARERQSAPAMNAFAPQASIRELMEAEVDPAADALWDAVRINVTLAGETDEQPRTEAQWQAVRRNALVLIEATNLLSMPGRRIVAPRAALPAGEADPALLQQRLDANPASFVALAQSLRAVSLKALDAIDARDANRLLEVGGDIDSACEACHLVYWYPPDLIRN